MFCKLIFFLQKSEFTMEVDEWVQVSHGICCMCGKSLQNSPKPVLIFPIYNIGVVYHVYSVCRPIHCKKLLVPQKNTHRTFNQWIYTQLIETQLSFNYKCQLKNNYFTWKWVEFQVNFRYSFSQRVIDNCTALPAEDVSCTTVNPWKILHH